MVALSKSIFKAYDIRGVIGKTLDAGVARQIGQAFGRAVLAKGERRVVIGRDGRLSGPELASALAQGLQAAGVDVIDLGVVATPMVYYGTKVLDAQSGIMVTGSHNPPDYNGFKMVLAGEAIHGATITALYDSIAAHDGAAVAAARQLRHPRHPRRLPRAHHRRRQDRAPDQDRGRLRQRRGRRVRRRPVPRHGLRSDRTVLRSRRQFSRTTTRIRRTRKTCRT